MILMMRLLLCLIYTTVPLSDFLDEQIARAREKELLKLIILMKMMMKTCLLFLRVMFLIKKLL